VPTYNPNSSSCHGQALLATVVLFGGIVAALVLYMNGTISSTIMIAIICATYAAYVLIATICNPLGSYLMSINKG
jgi:hypothetical protein